MRQCKRCGATIKSYSPMRKWCFDCRKKVAIEQAKMRKSQTWYERKESEQELS
ncbi:MAG: hypothetical protein QXU88_02115 [Candidatus Woesearchaeota archaeon]